MVKQVVVLLVRKSKSLAIQSLARKASGNSAGSITYWVPLTDRPIHVPFGWSRKTWMLSAPLLHIVW